VETTAQIASTVHTKVATAKTTGCLQVIPFASDIKDVVGKLGI
jgi:hypothetical protein